MSLPISSTRSGAGLWAELDAAGSAEDLRSALQARAGAFNIADLHSLAIVGAAPEGRRLAHICETQNIKIDAIVDDDTAKLGLTIAGVAVAPVDALSALAKSTPIVVASHRVLRVTQRLRDLGFRTVVPFAMLQVLAPRVFAPHMFYKELLEDVSAHRAEYHSLHQRLADDRSRDVLEAVIGFRRTLDPAVLRPVITEHDLYAPEGLFAFGDNEVYVDAGAYDGDTIRTFIERVNGRFNSVFAFEPDPITFAKLTENFRDEPRVRTVHAGLYSRSGSLHFRDDASRGAIFAADGEIEMPVTTLDEVVGDGPVTYVKMNIEGAEIDALAGARAAIRRELPRLALSVYHRPSDLWRIPEMVRQFSAGYDLYLRQHDGGIIETVLYAIHKK